MEAGPRAKDVRDAEELIRDKLSAAMMPMMLIFCTVNFVLVSAAISSARAATTNSSSHIVAVDIVSYTSIDIFLPGRYVFIILISGSE